MAQELSKEEKAFLAKTKSKAAEMVNVAKEKQAGGFMDDDEIIEVLELSHVDDQDFKTFKCQLIAASFATNKSGDPYFRFAWRIAEGDNVGITFSKYLGLGGKNKEDRAKEYKQLFGTLQRLDVDTTEWVKDEVMVNAMQAAKQLSSDKPGCIIGLCYWCKKIGDEEDPESDPRLNININGLFDASSLKKGFKPSSSNSSDSSEEYEDDDDRTFAQIGAECGPEEECPLLASEAKANDLDPDEYETWEELGEALDALSEESEEDEEFDPTPYLNKTDPWPAESKWISAEFDTGDGVITVYPVSYDAETQLFDLVDYDENEYSAEFEALTFEE